MGISNDIEPQTPDNYSRNWVTLGDGTWSTINDVVAGDPTLTGNFGILAQFLGAPGMSYAHSAIANPIEVGNSQFGIIANYNNFDGEVNRTGVEEIILPINSPYTPLNPSVFNSNRDDLIEYRVYEVDSQGNETFVIATTDTFATVSVSPNYQEYCFNVTAYWSTDDYGDLESNHSNTSCSVPFKFGDADFDSDTDINDVLTVVDFILEEDIPSDDEFRNVDINMDDEIDIADVILIVDIIFAPNARIMNTSNSTAYVDLVSSLSQGELSFEVENSGTIRGIEFEISYDNKLVDLLAPSLSDIVEDVFISSKSTQKRNLKIVAANLHGGEIVGKEDSYIKIPFNFMGSKYDESLVEISNVKLIGIDGGKIDIIVRTNNSKISYLPSVFALRQNYPNPFNPTTEIRFDVPENSYVTLAVHNMLGQKVKTLKSEELQAGYHVVNWDGTNELGKLMSSGMYFYSIQTSNFQATKKMLFLK
jgi:hypothetical protein